MYRFVALIWNRRDREASREAAALAAQFANEAEPCGRVLLDGLAVFYWQPRTHSLRSYHLPSGSGLILGRLFKHSTNDSASSLVVDISEMEAARIVATNGRHLVSDFWGSYVAILHDASTGESRVLRDCSGKIPCWRISVERVTIVFSNVDDVLPLISDSLSINWRYVAAFLFFDDLRTRESGITGISEVLAGGCVAVDKDGVVADSFCWNPADVYRRSGPLSDGDDCASAIRQNTQDCVDAWASVFKRILHNLSGGFDSAVVLSCLRNSPVQPLVTCLNRFTDRAQEDERAFAREAARLTDGEVAVTRSE
jgi:asparagine synthase (glutamine-hydrolysing)